MATATQTSRLKQRFEKWDVDHNGVLERSDYEAEARRIIKSFGETGDSPKGRALLNAYLQMYDQMAGKVGTTQGVTEQQYTQYVQNEMFSMGDAGFNRVLRPTISAIVNLCDTDGDGEINPREFAAWLRAVGVDSADAKAAFEQIDADGDGQLSVDELIQAVRDFHEGKSDVALLG
jgi:Ca2+-binding EF-hand superfamily protein